MNLTMYLNNGMSFNISVEGYNASEFSTLMNDSKVVTVSIGDIIVNKNAIFLIIPSEIITDK